MTNYDTNDEVKLQYAFFELTREKLIGRPEGPFALYDEEQHMIKVFGATDDDVAHLSLVGNAAFNVFQIAQTLRATFEVDDNQRVTCKIGSHTETSVSYALAALKTVLLAMSEQPARFRVKQDS